jgi:hypothetical protein
MRRDSGERELLAQREKQIGRERRGKEETSRDSLPTAEVLFPVYAEREAWPSAKDLVFIPDAIDQLGDAIWTTDDPALDEIRVLTGTYDAPPERVGILWSMVKLLEPLLVNGSLTTHVREVGGAGTGPLRDYLWDSDATVGAISTGKIGITGNDGVVRKHWVFLDRIEFDLLMLVYGPTGIPVEAVLDNYKFRHDRLQLIVMENLAPIARSRQASRAIRIGAGPARVSAGDDPSTAEFDRMFADAKRILEPHHQIELETRMANWLVARFDDDRLNTLKRKHYPELTRTAFSPYYSDEFFNRAWTLAIAQRPGRFKAGRPPARIDQT